jgi:hypothetical protein
MVTNHLRGSLQTLPTRRVNLSVFEDFCLSVLDRGQSGRPFASSRRIESDSHGIGWASTAICRMEIDESKLFCPVAPVFLESDQSALKTLAIMMIGGESERRR